MITLNDILKDLSMISDSRISVYDTDLNEIASYPRELSPFCNYIQKEGKIAHLCIKNDQHAFSVVRKTGTPYIYQCKFGLYEAVAPLYHFGTLSGYLMMGQTLDTLESSRNYTYSAAKDYIQNKQILKEIIGQIPTSTKDRILSCISIMNICASYITLSNLFEADTKDLAEKVRKYINQHFHLKITLELLCQRFFCSKATLTNVFRKSYQTTVNNYLISVRLNHAKKLIEDNTMSICSVSDNCGFSDQNYFTKVFKKQYGLTPTQYRKAISKVGFNPSQ